MRKLLLVTRCLVIFTLLAVGSLGGGPGTAIALANQADLGPELLINPGFELVESKLPRFVPKGALFRINPPGWAHYKVPHGWGWTTEEANSGRLAMKLVSQPDASVEGALFYQTLRDLELSPGDGFRLELAAKPYVSDVSSFRIAIRLQEGRSWTDIELGQFPPITSEEWIPMSFDFEIPAWVEGREGVTLRVGFGSRAGGKEGDYVYIDDVSLKRILSE